MEVKPKSPKSTQKVLILLAILNVLALFVELVPKDAPPFAGILTMVFLISNLFYFLHVEVRQINK